MAESGLQILSRIRLIVIVSLCLLAVLASCAEPQDGNAGNERVNVHLPTVTSQRTLLYTHTEYTDAPSYDDQHFLDKRAATTTTSTVVTTVTSGPLYVAVGANNDLVITSNRASAAYFRLVNGQLQDQSGREIQINSTVLGAGFGVINVGSNEPGSENRTFTIQNTNGGLLIWSNPDFSNANNQAQFCYSQGMSQLFGQFAATATNTCSSLQIVVSISTPPTTTTFTTTNISYTTVPTTITSTATNSNVYVEVEYGPSSTTINPATLTNGACLSDNGNQHPLHHLASNYNKNYAMNQYNLANNTIENCQGFCYSTGFEYSATTPSDCYCDNQINSYSYGTPGQPGYFQSGMVVANSFCNVACNGNSSEICGGTNYASYAVAQSQAGVPTRSCTTFRKRGREARALVKRNSEFLENNFPSALKAARAADRRWFKFYRTVHQHPWWPAYYKAVVHIESYFPPKY